MPGLITHYLLGQNVLRQMNQNISNTLIYSHKYNLKNIILKNPSAFNLGSPGPDIFFYYLPSLIGKKDKNIGAIMHTERIGEFFNIYIDYMNSLNKEDKEIAVSYLSGFLGHYILDSTTHPYIYYYSGFPSTEKESRICNAKHRHFETLIDTLMFEKLRGLKPSNFNTSWIFQTNKKDSSVLVPLLTKTINKTYDLKITKSFIQSVLLIAQKESRFLVSKNNRKKMFITYIENKTIKYPIITSLIYADNINNEIDCLNEKKRTWYLPWDNQNPKNQSFIELFYNAANYTRYLLKLLEYYLNNGIKAETLLDKIGNNSYHTGLNCNQNIIFKYSENIRLVK